MYKIINLSKKFINKNNNEVNALQNVSFELPQTGLVSLVGKSGSGKSTLLFSLSGMVLPISGEISFQNKDLGFFTKGEFDYYRAHSVGVVFQEYNLIETLNVKENISLGLELLGITNSESLIANSLKAVELEGFENRLISELSVGQKQRVAIARTLAKDPSVILCDEPTAALDEENGAIVWNILRTLAKNRLVIVATHEVEAAENYSDEILKLEAGLLIDHKIINKRNKEEEVLESNEKSEKKSFSLKFKSLWRLTWSKLKKRKNHAIITTLLLFITLTLFGSSLMISTYNYDKKLPHEMMASLHNYIAFRKDTKDENGHFVYGNDTFTSTDFTFLAAETGQSFIYSTDETKQDTMNFARMPQQRVEYYPRLDRSFKVSEYDESFFDEAGFNIVVGDVPVNDNEVLLTKFYYESFKTYGYSYGAVQIEPADISMEGLVGKPLGDATKTPYYIAGFVDTNFPSDHFPPLKGELDSNDKKMYALSLELIYLKKYSLHNQFFVNDLDIFLHNHFSSDIRDGLAVSYAPKSIETLKKMIELGDGKNYTPNVPYFYLQHGSESKLDSVNDILKPVGEVFLVVSIIALLFSAIMFLNYAKNSVDTQMKEIGIYKSLGISDLDINKVFLYQNVLITTISTLTSLILNFVISVLLNKVLYNQFLVYTSLISLSFWNIVVVIAINFLLAGIATQIALYKTRKLQIFDLLK